MKKFGQGARNIIFLHGGGIRYTAYNCLLKKLGENFTVYAFDLPGHGKNIPTSDPDQAIQQVISQIKALNLESCILIGHSFGGFCAYQAAKQLTIVTNVILFDPLLTTVQDSRLKLLWLFFFYKNWRGVYFHPNLVKFYFNGFKNQLEDIYLQKLNSVKTIKLLFNSCYLEKDLQSVNENSFKLNVIFGEQDSIIHVKDFPESFQKLITYVPGEHDWCMGNVSETTRIVAECLTCSL
ncbi:MAG: alpha/beta hydrolase [bacterium]